MNKKLGIIKDTAFFLHNSSEAKFEKPDRLKEIYNYLENNAQDFIFYKSEKIPEDELKKLHSSFYVKQIKKYSSGDEIYNYDKDTYINGYTYDVARLAAGGCVVLADKIMNDEISKGFAIVRPPGHHAEIGRAMGFCIFNNTALTAQYLIDTYNLSRILIVDFDAHHGNGTQEIFYSNDNVLVISIHQNNIFPLTGKGEETGEDSGLGYNINIPVHPYFGDEEYSYIFGKLIQQVAETFLPQIILVSAGFDGHIDDTASNLHLTEKGFENITKFLTYLSNKFSDGKLLYILEGGYNEAALYSSLLATIKILQAPSSTPPGFMFSARASKILETEIPPELISKWGLESN